MPQAIRCPACQTVNTFDEDWAGMRVPCQQCGAALIVPSEGVAEGLPPIKPPGVGPSGGKDFGRVSSGPPPLPSTIKDEWDDDTTSAPSYRRKGYEEDRAEMFEEDRPGHYLNPAWNMVRIGLGLMYGGTVALFLGFLLMMCFGLLIQSTGNNFGRNDDAILGLLALFLIGALAIAGIVALVGQCICCGVPGESGVKGLAIGSVVGLGATVVLGLAILFFVVAFGMGNHLFGRGVRDFQGAEFIALLLLLTLGIAAIVSHLMFLCFLRGVARFFRQESMAASANGYIVLYMVDIGLNLFFGCLGTIVGDPSMGMVVSLLGLVSVVVALVLFVWYLRLLNQTREAITRVLNPRNPLRG